MAKNRKKCAGCGKEIPGSARACVFCGAKQEYAPLPTAALGIPILQIAEPELETAPAATPPLDTPPPAALQLAREATPVVVATPTPIPPAADPVATTTAGGVQGIIAASANVPAPALQEITAPMAERVSPAAAAPHPVVVVVNRAEAAPDAAKEPRPRSLTPSGPHRPAPSQTANTLLGIEVDRAALDAAVAQAKQREVEQLSSKREPSRRQPEPAPLPPPPTTETVPVAAAPDRKPAAASLDEEAAPPATPWHSKVGLRAVMPIAGLVLIGLYLVSFPLAVALAGTQLRFHYSLFVGGLVLVVGGLLPMPERARAGVAALVGVIVAIFALPAVDGLAGVLGLVIALVVCLLPGGILARARADRERGHLTAFAGLAITLAAPLTLAVVGVISDETALLHAGIALLVATLTAAVGVALLLAARSADA